MSETTTIDDVTAWWATSITRIAPGEIDLRGYPIETLIGTASFVDVVQLLTLGELPDPRRSALLEAAMVASVDHGPQAPSIASARMAATTGVGINSAIANGINVLGDVHGGAGQQCVQVLAEIVEAIDAGESPSEAARAAVARLRSQGLYVPGFGHRFHPVDPRRAPLLHLLETARADGVIDGRFLEAGLAVEEVLAAGRRPVPINVDGLTAIIYGELGVAPELARGLFVLSRSVGILAHAWEEQQGGRRIKGPLPKTLLADYDGPSRRLPGSSRTEGSAS